VRTEREDRESAVGTLTPAQESLFLTLHLRALDSRSARPILGDTASAELAGTVGYDFT
jgi:O-methyltransferase involved in polyketide biosynthesis